MNEIYILIMVIGFNAYSGGTTVQQEFSSREACEKAREDLNMQLNDWSRAYVNIRAQRCYKK